MNQDHLQQHLPVILQEHLPSRPPAQDPGEEQLWFELQRLPQEPPPGPDPPRPRPLLVVLLVLGFCSCAGVLGLVYYLSCSPAHQVDPCLSPACQWASARISRSADPFTRPCDHVLSSCETRDVSLDRTTALLRHLREVLESSGRHRSSAVQKTRNFYSSCLDTGSIAAAGAEPFLALVERLGGWAVRGQWNQTDFNSTLLSVLMRDFSTFPFFNVFVGPDPRDSGSNKSRRYIQIDQPDLMIPIEWNGDTQKSQANPQMLRVFLASCQEYLALLGAPPINSVVHVWTFVSLSSELAVAAAPLDQRRAQGQLDQRMSLRELQIQAPAIDWLGCLRTVFYEHHLSEDDPVLVQNLPYIVQMSKTIDKWRRKQDLKASGPLNTYMILNLLHTFMPALDSRFSETSRNISASTRDSEEVLPRWRHCLLETEKGFDLVLKHLLRERSAHREAGEMIQNIFSSVKTKLTELEWRNESTRQLVMEKVQSLVFSLETNSDGPSQAELDLMFSEVSVSRSSFFSNYVRLLSLWQKRRSRLLTDLKERVDVLSLTPSLLGKRLVFPPGMFVPPLFHPSYPRALNYGVTGFKVAKDVLRLLLPDIWLQSRSARSVSACVWTHYLSVAGRTGGGAGGSEQQQQEVWVQHSALQVALKSYAASLKVNSSDSSISGLAHARLLLTGFAQMCVEDASLPPSFLLTSVCAASSLCPARRCPHAARRPPC